jgi:hypothetical protein
MQVIDLRKSRMIPRTGRDRVRLGLGSRLYVSRGDVYRKRGLTPSVCVGGSFWVDHAVHPTRQLSEQGA